MNTLHIVAFTLLVVGGLNWLVLALFGWDIGNLFGGQEAALSRIVYILVGLAAIFEIATHGSRCKDCASAMKGQATQ